MVAPLLFFFFSTETRFFSLFPFEINFYPCLHIRFSALRYNYPRASLKNRNFQAGFHFSRPRFHRNFFFFERKAAESIHVNNRRVVRKYRVPSHIITVLKGSARSTRDRVPTTSPSLNDRANHVVLLCPMRSTVLAGATFTGFP